MPEGPHPPSPVSVFEAINAYQRTAVIRAGIELDLFTAIAEGKVTPAGLAGRCGASERGLRILCDNLVIGGFLTKEGGRYGLTPDTAAFLTRSSPAYMGGAIEFLLADDITAAFARLTDAVRKGGTALAREGTVETEHPVWVKFARAMMPMMALPARQIAEIVKCDLGRKLRVLDIAAGHGLFGIALARRYPQAEIAALDWPAVLEVAKENARTAGVAERYRTIEGSAFDVEFGSGYDLILLTNFLHHFDVPTCEGLLRKVRAALGDGGRAVTLEFVPDEDRVTPPNMASFSLVMLASTPSGDAYTFRELEGMFRSAGFSRSEVHGLQPPMEQVIISYV